MKNVRSLVLGAAVLFAVNTGKAQDSLATAGTGETNKPIWSIGLSGVVVDDDGQPFNDLFNVGDSWNFLPFPTRLHVDAALNEHWSVEGALAFSQYQTGKVLNDISINEDHSFIAFDANAKYHFMDQMKTFDPYAVAGLGFTYRSALQEQTPTLNLGVGANIWFVKNFGLTLQTSAKIKLNSKSSNYLMHSAGLVYRFVKD